MIDPVLCLLSAATFGSFIGLVYALVRPRPSPYPINGRHWVWTREGVAMFGEMPPLPLGQKSKDVVEVLDRHGFRLVADLTPCPDVECGYVGGWHAERCGLRMDHDTMSSAPEQDE